MTSARKKRETESGISLLLGQSLQLFAGSKRRAREISAYLSGWIFWVLASAPSWQILLHCAGLCLASLAT